jgi:hypothetical protein
MKGWSAQLPAKSNLFGIILFFGTLVLRKRLLLNFGFADGIGNEFSVLGGLFFRFRGFFF